GSVAGVRRCRRDDHAGSGSARRRAEPVMSERTRREVLYATGGAARGGCLGGFAGPRVIPPAAAETATQAATVSTDGVLDLYVNEGLVPMVDDSLVYMRGFGGVPTELGAPSPAL